MSKFVIPSVIDLRPVNESGELGDIVVLEGQALQRDSASAAVKPAALTLIPYYSWVNRGKGEMEVWLPAQTK